MIIQERVKEIRLALVADAWPVLQWEIAEKLEEMNLGKVHASAYQRKNNEFLRVEPNAALFSIIGSLPCNDSGVCQTCNGEGEHLRFSYQWEDCETCEGTGICPCTHD